MAAPRKVELSYKLDNASSIASFIGWYEEAKRTINPESGRKRKGNAKKVIQDYLESVFKQGKNDMTNINQKPFMEAVIQFKEDNKLPKELQRAKNTLSTEEYETFKSYYEKIQKEEAKNSAD